MTPHTMEFVFRAVTQNILTVALDRFGCCVVQDCLDSPDLQLCREVTMAVVENVLAIAVNKFGNYVVQYILDLKQPALTLQVARALEGSLAELSLQKFSSNVIEKCLTCGEPQVVGLVARELLEAPALASLLHDPFANYVVQTLLNVSTAEHAELILNRLQPHIGTLRSTLYGKRIQARLLRRFPHP